MLNSENSQLIKVPHGFLGNSGGVSKGVYNSLNCGPGSRDTKECITENRRRAVTHLSGDPCTPLVTLYQIHSNFVHTVTPDNLAERPKADAMVTKHSEIVLGILTADCTPVLFIDYQAGVVGAAHSGWKGAFAGVIENTILAMEHLGAQRHNIIAATGPTIQQASYEVGAEFRSTFCQISDSHQKFFIKGRDDSHFQFDLMAFVRSKIIKAGIADATYSKTDTYQSQTHFSYRRTCHKGESDYGRQIAMIMLPT